MNYLNKYDQYLKSFNEILSDNSRDLLDSYFQLLLKNALPRGYIGEAPEEILWQRHILDSILVLQNPEVISLLQNYKSVIDLGSGAGLPGLALAILFSDTKFYLIETMQKRCIFLNECIESLNLKNVQIVNKRVEDVTKNDLPDKNQRLILFRAFLKPLVSLELSLNIINPGSKVLYWRSRRFDISDVELQDETEKRLHQLGFRVKSFVTLDCPEELNSRGFYLFDYTGKPASGFPRKWNKIKNDSLCNRVS